MRVPFADVCVSVLFHAHVCDELAADRALLACAQVALRQGWLKLRADRFCVGI